MMRKGGRRGYNAALRFYVLAHPRPVQVVAPAAVPALPTPALVLTVCRADSAAVARAKAAVAGAPKPACVKSFMEQVVGALSGQPAS